jgi:DNA-binding transcriptional LysR family regulator
MEFNQIRYFQNLADTLNPTEAAMRSGMSQPTLTRAIQRLEQELGGTLVYRDGKDSRLTALGRDIRSEFAAIAEREQRVRALSLNRVRGRRETLTLGVVNTIAPALITRFVTRQASRPPPISSNMGQVARAELMQSRDFSSSRSGILIVPKYRGPRFRTSPQPHDTRKRR